MVTADLPDPDAPNALPRILSVSSPYINADSLRTSGMDLERPEHDVPAGRHQVDQRPERHRAVRLQVHPGRHDL
ncbi:hypothetical protein ACRAWD_05735 [Caulobacter segnis]